ncbi:MAG: hypothetical protein KAS32_10015 [Candidatus Peribacteraceae bacterium]|nr:hypothetical protein [Candidatus Peribacteraceae bacterium]
MNKLYILHVGGQEIEFSISQYTFDELSDKIAKIVKGKVLDPLKVETQDGFRYFIPKSVLENSLIIIEPEEEADSESSPDKPKPYTTEGKLIKVNFDKG